MREAIRGNHRGHWRHSDANRDIVAIKGPSQATTGHQRPSEKPYTLTSSHMAMESRMVYKPLEGATACILMREAIRDHQRSGATKAIRRCTGTARPRRFCWLMRDLEPP